MFIEIQRHKQAIMIFVIIFIGLPLAFFVPGMGGGSGGSGQIAGDSPVAQVGSTAVTADQFWRAYQELTRRRAEQNLSTEASDLVDDGTITDLLDQLIDATMVTIESEKKPIYPDQDYLEVALRQQFEDADGIFQGAAYNNWVKASNQRNVNWDEIYESVARDVNRRLYLQLISSSAQVFEETMKTEFKTLRSKMKVKYAAIEPVVEKTDEELSAFYEESPENYMSPVKVVADYISISLRPEKPVLVSDVLKRLGDGEDFAEVAKAFSMSEATATDGGDLGWIAETETVFDSYKPLLALSPGEVSEVMEQESGYTIFKSEEERVNEETGVREVHGREIVIRAELTPEEKETLEFQATGIINEMIEAEKNDPENFDFRTLAEAKGYTVQTSPAFSATDSEIEGIEPRDVFQFRQEVFTIHGDDAKKYSDVFEAQKNLFVVSPVSSEDPVQLTFEEAKEDVERDAIALHKNGPDYFDQLTTYITGIREKATSLEEAAELFPELNLEIKETSEFGTDDFLFSEGVFWQPQDAFGVLANREPGSLGGPIADFQRVNHFLELVSLTPPDEAEFELEWGEQSQIILEGMLGQARMERQLDYLMYLSEQAQADDMIQRDYGAIESLLGLDETESDDVFDEIPETPVSESLTDIEISPGDGEPEE